MRHILMAAAMLVGAVMITSTTAGVLQARATQATSIESAPYVPGPVQQYRWGV
ncbi:MAG: hypothetical protein JSR90_02405 [Proteobacteria bacterium]|nr:hypothetical protein [Pseudomonadota bacterium]